MNILSNQEIMRLYQQIGQALALEQKPLFEVGGTTKREASQEFVPIQTRGSLESPRIISFARFVQHSLERSDIQPVSAVRIEGDGLARHDQVVAEQACQ